MKALLGWFDERTGLLGSASAWLDRPVAGGPAWRFVWPATIVFAFVTQLITGLVVWMYYSPGSQSSWESVYYLQYHVQAGWLLRAMHHYAAQVTLLLVGIYLLQMIFRGSYRAPREMLFWVVLLLGMATLGCSLTGDLLSWDQNSYWATHVRTGFLYLVPQLGDSLYKLAVGGAEFGNLTLTRFLALHIGACTAAFAVLLLAHAHLAYRHGLESGDSATARSYWPGQALRDAVACVAVLVVILALSLQHGTSGPHAGIALGSPANPVEDPGTARPEWSFRGLFQFRELFPSSMEIVPIFVIPGITVLVFFAMPLLARSQLGHCFNQVVTLVVFGGLAILAAQSYLADARNEPYQLARVRGIEQADRVKALAGELGIPPTGALALLRDDSKTQGPLIFNQHCASCHDYSGENSGIVRPEKPTAADLYQFAGRDWLTGFLTVKGISSPKYFGNTKFKQSGMYGFIKETFEGKTPEEGLEPEKKEQIIRALSAEAMLRSQCDADAKDAADIAAGRKLMGETCTDCHTFHGKGTASGPDLNAYGSREWLVGIISDPAHRRFYYKEKNDRMPAYAESATEPVKNILTGRQIEMLVEWLRGECFEPGEKRK